jgi:membrane protein DedA with SNARE-associated domain
VQPVLDWLAGLPVAALYLSLAAIAAIENIFPPVPADTIVAFGSFLAARGQGTLLGAFLSTWLGNVGGALFMYWIGRRYGAGWMERRWGTSQRAGQARVVDLYGRYGVLALFMSRFLPGIRALVPPVAGALRIGFPGVAIAMATASAIWYGAISVIAFKLGSDWESVVHAISRFGRVASLAAGAAVLLALAGILIYRRRQR